MPALLADVLVPHQKDKGCLPCFDWFISKDNNCVACNQGASDYASMNTMGNSYTFATRCIPDICPWPYVPPGALAVGAPAIIKEGRARKQDIEFGAAVYVEKGKWFKKSMRKISD
jgi:hypothetical protein